jgi:hypothetical protein
VFGVLKEIFRCDEVAAQGFGACELKVTLIISLRIPGLRRRASLGKASLGWFAFS